jgi:acyl carrier protein
MDGVATAVRSYILDEFGIDANSLQNDTSLFSSGLLDSFSMVDLLSFVEKLTARKFRVVDVNLDNLDSIDRIVAFLERDHAP